MKFTKKLKAIMLALPLMILSTAAAVTGTVAWFAANNVVTVNNMTVNAKSDTAYLLIGNSTQNTVQLVQNAKSTSATATTDNANLLPVAHDSFASNGIAGIESVTNTKYDSWYYGYSNDPAQAALNETTKSYVDSDKFASYVMKNEFHVCTAVGSNPMANLRVKDLTYTTTGDKAVKVIVASSTAHEEFADAAVSTRANPVTLASSVNSENLVDINVYIYWDGNDSDVYTNGIADLVATTLSFTLVADITAA